ncbi:MAG: NAD(P)/FAD-dependent oxidoreductase [Acidimicrobiales bacterium]
MERTAVASVPSSGAHRCVVIGGGFGGINVVKELERSAVDVTLIDRHNYHLFQPLNYQVATGSLSPAEIATPLRKIFKDDKRVHVLLGEATEIDIVGRRVRVEFPVPGVDPLEVPYDSLVVAGGSSYSYFGHEQWRSLALEVKSLDSALEVRGRILQGFEAAEFESVPDKRTEWLTFVVVGGGPTGVEMAGQIAELARDTLPGEFRVANPASGQVLLVETADRVLPAMVPSLSRHAGRSLQRLGVTLLTSHTVVDVQADHVDVAATDGSTTSIPTHTVVWAAGVTASPLASLLGGASGAEVDRAGRLVVEPDLTLPGHPEVIALGDMVSVRDARTGKPRVLPGLAPVAIQQGKYAGRLIRARLEGAETTAFHYRDKGTLATIGRARAVADIHGIRLSGFVAWVTWLIVHLFYLIGFENRLIVISRWSYSFLTRGRSTRLITDVASFREDPARRRDA